MSLVGQRVFPDLVCVLRRYHLFRDFLVCLRLRSHDETVLEFELNAGNFVAVAVERLVKFYPAVRPPPIGRGKYLEARYVAPRAREPVPFFAEFYPEVHVWTDGVKPINLRRKRVEPAAVLFYLAIYALPFGDGVFLVEEARLYNLVPIFLFGESSFFRHRRSPVERDGPGEFIVPLLRVPPIHEVL